MNEILIILFLILLNGVFAMSEIALVSARKTRLQKAARGGDLAARKALELAENPTKLLSTVQIGITLIGILTGIYSGEKIEDDLQQWLTQFESLKEYSETIAVGVIVVVLTFFSLVLGELVPKRIGLVIPETVARLFSIPMYVISKITAPFIWLLTFTSDILIRLLRIRKSRDNQVTEDEIKAMVREGAEAGTVEEIEQDIVENVFHLGDRRINTLMTSRFELTWINIEDEDQHIFQTILESTHKSFPACKGNLDHPLGILHSKDLLNGLLSGKQVVVEDLITPALFITENITAYKALEKFKAAKQRVALVVDELGILQGMVTRNDLIDVLIGDLAEQLHEKKEIIPRDDGSFLVDAGLSLPEFARYFDIDLTNKEELSNITTVGGLILHIGRSIPQVGAKLTWDSLSIEVVDLDGRRVDKVLVKRV